MAGKTIDRDFIDIVQAFRALQGLIMSVVLTAVDDKHANPIWPAMGYPGQPPHSPSPLNDREPPLPLYPLNYNTCFGSIGLYTLSHQTFLNLHDCFIVHAYSTSLS